MFFLKISDEKDVLYKAWPALGSGVCPVDPNCHGTGVITSKFSNNKLTECYLLNGNKACFEFDTLWVTKEMQIADYIFGCNCLQSGYLRINKIEIFK
jgi:hypothetical protein